MGIYYNHSIVYMIDGKIVINGNESDNRLVLSKFYKNNQKNWFNLNISETIIKIYEYVDIELTNDEKVSIKNLISDDSEHGWYHFFDFGDSYSVV
jgi:hypothetical protein